MFTTIRRAPGALALLAFAAGLAMGSAQAQTTSFVTFDPPGLAQGPSIYVAVPGIQVIDVPGVASFDGGVVLGLATFFPAITFASSPNVYGTADFGNKLARTLTINIAPNTVANEVSFALFNGETFNQSYTARAFDAAGNLLTSQNLANVAPNWLSGYGVMDLVATGISKVTIDADGAPAAFDFLIDDVAFNQSLTTVIPSDQLPPVYSPPAQPAQPVEVQLDTLNVVVLDEQGHRQRRRQKGKGFVQVNYGDDINNIQSEVLLVDAPLNPVPEPSSVAMMVLGLAGMGALLRRRRID